MYNDDQSELDTCSACGDEEYADYLDAYGRCNDCAADARARG